MNVLYLLPFRPPKFHDCEAVSQEISLLRRHINGQVLYINPNRRSRSYIPRAFFGFHRLKEIRELEQHVQIHHFYNSDLFAFPILRWLRRPVVYSLNCGLKKNKPNLRLLKAMAAVTVYDQRSFNRLRDWGLDNLHLVHPGKDSGRFTYAPTRVQGKFRILMASAPWTRKQFRTKGVEALLAAAVDNPSLHFVFLWRGVLAREMEARVHQLGLRGRVSVINRPVHVNQVLSEVHATIILASDSDIVKAYPHSLLDSLAAGKPVLVSRAIPMANYVERTGCGVVVERVKPEDVLGAVKALRDRYDSASEIARSVGKRDFNGQDLVESFQSVYRTVEARFSHACQLSGR